MDLVRDFEERGAESTGRDMLRFIGDLFPICRSITGEGLRRSLAHISSRIQLQLSEVPTGTQVFDWTVPKEWNVRDAYIMGPDGKKIVDFKRSSLHVLNYSSPIRDTLTLSALKPHLFTIPEHPDWIPYRTSYYEEKWGFCLSHNQLLAMDEGPYEVCIDSTLEDGHLTYGECYLPGRVPDEVLISCHACHPSLANDNLSGVCVATFLAGMLAGQDRHFSYRFLFIPGTIGAITWLARNRETVNRIRHGLVLTCVGDSDGFHYKRSRKGNAEIDRAVEHVLRHCGEPFEILEFTPLGYDERQYCSPGFNLPVGCLMRSVWGRFPEYHTSADNMEFVQPSALAGALRVCATTLEVLDNNRRYRSLNPHCEPQLGRRGLYRTGCGEEGENEISARLWVLNLSDGSHSLLDIAERSGLPFATVRAAAGALSRGGLLSELPG